MKVQPTPVPIQHQNYLALRGFSCFDASTCQVWGSDSGGASAGPLMATRVSPGSGIGCRRLVRGRAPAAGGSRRSGPDRGGPRLLRPHLHGGRRAAELASYPFEVTLAPVVWTARCRRRVAGGGGGYGWHRRWRRWFDGSPR